MSKNLDNSKKHTYISTARLNIRTLAAIVKYYIEQRGFTFDSRNEALSTGFEHLRIALDLKKPSPTESITILKRAGLFSRKNGNTKLQQALREEGITEDFSDKDIEKHVVENEPEDEPPEVDEDLDEKIKEAQKRLNNSKF